MLGSLLLLDKAYPWKSGEIFAFRSRGTHGPFNNDALRSGNADAPGGEPGASGGLGRCCRSIASALQRRADAVPREVVGVGRDAVAGAIVAEVILGLPRRVDDEVVGPERELGGEQAGGVE